MNRTVLLALVGALLSGCMSIPALPNHFAPYRALEAAATTSAPVGRKAYRLGRVTVRLQQDLANDAFPDAAGLTEIFTALLQRDLESRGLLAAPDEDALDVDFDIRYQRVFAGEASAPAGEGGSSSFDYSSRLRRNGIPLADYRSQRYFRSMGVAGSLPKTGRHAAARPEDEQSALAVYATAMVEQLPR